MATEKLKMVRCLVSGAMTALTVDSRFVLQQNVKVLSGSAASRTRKQNSWSNFSGAMEYMSQVKMKQRVLYDNSWKPSTNHNGICTKGESSQWISLLRQAAFLQFVRRAIMRELANRVAREPFK
jgi:hypothetical protein